MFKNVYLLLGSNMGNRADRLLQAVGLIDEQAGRVVKLSSLYETEPWGMADQGVFLNIAVELETWLEPPALLQLVLDIELQIGRTRLVPKYGPRVIDIDIILFADEVIETEGLTVPHPAMAQRRFTLAPMAEIAGNTMHPALHKTMQQLLDECPDTLQVHNVGTLTWQPKNA